MRPLRLCSVHGKSKCRGWLGAGSGTRLAQKQIRLKIVHRKEGKFIASSVVSVPINHIQEFLSKMIRQCAGEFSRMVSISSENLEGEVQQKAKEQADRFRLWASHIGVFATPRWSLDYRLRKSPEVSSIIVGMLEVLKFKVKGLTHSV